MSALSLIVAEKPSVARDIAKALNGKKKDKTCWEAEGFRIIWALGHLVRLSEPHEINPEWKKWRADLLPMVPNHWPLKVIEKTKDHYEVIRRHLLDELVTEVICATDAGREGEHIFRLIVEKTGCRKPVRRLWISSLTGDAIRRGMKSLRDSRDFDLIAAGAMARSKADWLTGMNLSRIYSLAARDQLSIGRVQTPTLQMIVQREQEIRNFKPTPFREIRAIFSLTETKFDPLFSWRPATLSAEKHENPGPGQYEAWYLGKHENRSVTKPSDPVKSRRLADDKKAADAIIGRLQASQATISEISEKQTKILAPDLYDLTELQRHANRLYKFSAKKTMELAQSLYESRKAISYPRTDCRYLSDEEEKNLPSVARAISAPYELILAEGTGGPLPDRRFIQGRKVTEHHAIIPTGQDPGAISIDEHRIYDLICRRFLCMWHEPYLSSTITFLTTALIGESQAQKECYFSSGTRLIRKGWKIMEQGLASQDHPDKGSFVEAFAKISDGQRVWPLAAQCRRAETRAPAPLSEAAVLSGMETAGRHIEEKTLSKAMKGKGLGTPATRAGIIESLKKKKFVFQSGRALRATEKGIRLIEMVREDLKSPRLTGEWEEKLEKINQGEGDPQKFIRDISRWVGRQVRLAEPSTKANAEAKGLPSIPESNLATADPIRGQQTQEPDFPPSISGKAGNGTTKPLPFSDRMHSREVMLSVLQGTFRLSSFRPGQQEVCEALIHGKNCLIIMPTGSGKSLCYQLPGLIRNGVTLIISPLIALMEDQAQALNQKGLMADCIHTGRERWEAREALHKYRNGTLRFLFVSPERLGVPGFVPWLERHPPCLIAIDEAHCISQWGHDFRADYRLLSGRLKGLSHIPKAALTATATPKVSRDIIRELKLVNCKEFTSGFRRTNIKIIAKELKPGDRLAAAMSYLSDPSHRPAIIYAPTRAETERVAGVMQKLYQVRPYHAGLSPQLRNRTQREFMQDRIEVIAATVAFGMGVDKPNIRTVIHLALPSEIAGYYQEIGRAGRDQKPSSALLFYSAADYKIQSGLYQHSYPDPEVLEKFLEQIGKGCSVEAAQSFTKEAQVQICIQKLLVHGAIRFNPIGDLVSIPKSDWKSRYLLQKQHKEQQMRKIMNYSELKTGCRMTELIRHFDEKTDDQVACGLCDLCNPDPALFHSYRQPTKSEIRTLDNLWHCAVRQGYWSKSALYKSLSTRKNVDKNHFEILLDSLLNAGYLDSEWSEFRKGNRTIRYQKIQVPHSGLRKKPRASWQDLKIPEAKYIC